MTNQKQMVFQKTWKEFQKSGLLWFMNTFLHMFGWAIVVVQKDDGKISDVYPARVKFRGFGEDSNTKGYLKVTEFMKKNINKLLKEAMDK